MFVREWEMRRERERAQMCNLWCCVSVWPHNIAYIMNVHYVQNRHQVCETMLCPCGTYACHWSVKNNALKSFSTTYFSGRNAARFMRWPYQLWRRSAEGQRHQWGIAAATWGHTATIHFAGKATSSKSPQRGLGRLQKHKTETEILKLENWGGNLKGDELQVELWLWSHRLVGVVIEGELS